MDGILETVFEIVFQCDHRLMRLCSSWK